MKIKLLSLVLIVGLVGCGGGETPVKDIADEVNVDHCNPAEEVVVCGVVDGKETSFMNDCFAAAYGAIDIRGGLCDGDK